MPFDPRPFDPRLIHPEDAPLRLDGDLDLPADLAALAEQLADDAAHLSARYPANREPQVALAAELVDSAERIKSAGERRRTSWRQVALIAGAGLASVAAVVFALSMATRPTDGPRAVDLVAAPATSAREAELAPTSASASLVPTNTSVSLGELSAPEMEALFDLLQRDADRTSSVSF